MKKRFFLKYSFLIAIILACGLYFGRIKLGMIKHERLINKQLNLSTTETAERIDFTGDWDYTIITSFPDKVDENYGRFQGFETGVMAVSSEGGFCSPTYHVETIKHKWNGLYSQYAQFVPEKPLPKMLFCLSGAESFGTVLDDLAIITYSVDHIEEGLSNKGQAFMFRLSPFKSECRLLRFQESHVAYACEFDGKTVSFAEFKRKSD